MNPARATFGCKRNVEERPFGRMLPAASRSRPSSASRSFIVLIAGATELGRLSKVAFDAARSLRMSAPSNRLIRSCTGICSESELFSGGVWI
jgi:hypothetical protein